MRSFLAAACCVLAACGVEPEAPPRPIEAVSQRAELRPTDSSSGLQWRYLGTDVVESWGEPDGGVLVHFTRAGVNAVPAADVNTNTVPDLVEAVAQVYEEVSARYAGPMGFRPPVGDSALPNNGGDGRFDVYLLDFARAADGAFRVDQCTAANPEICAGYVVQENDFVGYGYPNATVATRILGSHEYFHAVQAAYDNGQEVVFSEGMAVWASEQFDPALNDFENFIGAYLSRVDRSLDSPPPGPVPSFAYGSAIFFQFLSERFDPALLRKLLEACENGRGHASDPDNVANPSWIRQLDALLKADYQSSFSQAFAEFATWNLYLGPAADTAKSYAGGARYPGPLMTPVSVPLEQKGLRVYYASTHYYRSSSLNRAEVTAALLDDPSLPGDETEGLKLVLTTRAARRNLEVVTVADVTAGTQTVSTPGTTELIVAVINTLREGTGALLSKRPTLCIGTVDEVAACTARSFPPDAGAEVDAGTAQPDAGAGSVDGGTGTPPPPPTGCGCTSGVELLSALALLAFAPLLRRRRRGP